MRDRGALDSDAVARRIRRIDRDLVVGLISLLNTQVEILQIDVEVGKNQFSRILCQMIRVIASPSISTTGFLNLDFRHSLLLSLEFAWWGCY